MNRLLFSVMHFIVGFVAGWAWIAAFMELLKLFGS